MSEKREPSQKWALYRELRRDFRERTSKPLRHPSFIAFFLLAVVGLGALGFWLELYVLLLPSDANCLVEPLCVPERSSLEALRTALITYFPAVAGTSAMQLMWSGSTKHFRSAAVLLLFASLVVALLIFPSQVTDGWAIGWGGLMSIAALWLWWIANANQPELLDDVNPNDPVGGDDPTVELSGDPTGWTTN